MEDIRSLYISGLSKREIHALGKHSWAAINTALSGQTRSLKEAAVLSGQRRTALSKHLLTSDQKSMIYGSLLGDSSLTSYGPPSAEVGKPRYSIMFSNVHCDAQFGYVEHMRSVLPAGNIYTRIQDSGYKVGNPIHRFVYRNKGALLDIWDDVIIEGKKTITNRWVRHVTPLAIAYWFMDDGTSCYMGKSVVVRFSTYSFSGGEIDLLRERLHDFGFTSYVQESKHGPVISLSKMDTPSFMEFVSPIVSQIPCMTYKLKFPKKDSSSDMV